MVRKQLYIEERQERALKARAAELGVSEAAFVRAALDKALKDPAALRSDELDRERRRALERLLVGLKEASQVAQIEPGYKFKREDAYDDPRYGREWNKPDQSKS